MASEIDRYIAQWPDVKPRIECGCAVMWLLSSIAAVRLAAVSATSAPEMKSSAITITERMLASTGLNGFQDRSSR
jgi:hypothetical protein